MAKKSAAQFKPVHHKEEIPNFRPLEELFEEAKNGILLIIESNVEVAKRVDNLATMRETAYRFYGSAFDDKLPVDRMGIARKLLDKSVETYEKVLERAKTFELEEFKKEDMKDYFENIVPDIEHIYGEDDLLEAIVVFQCVQPYGSKMNQLHQMILEEIEKRESYNDD